MSSLSSLSEPSPAHHLLLRRPPSLSAPVRFRRRPYHPWRPRVAEAYGRTVVVREAQGGEVLWLAEAEELERLGRRALRRRAGPGGAVRFASPAEREKWLAWVGGAAEDAAAEGGEWRFVKRVGRGGGGSVWMAERETEVAGRTRSPEEEVVGVKVVEKSGLSEGALKRVVEERVALERIREMDGLFVVRLLAAWQSCRRLYLGMGLWELGDLGRVVRRRGRLSERVVRGILSEVVLGLEELRQLGYVHRDIKLENILVSRAGHVAIGDLGLVKDLKQGQTDGTIGRTRSFCGTRSSMAPEMIMGREYGYSVDMWALGVLMYRLLTGRMPFSDSRDGSSIELFHSIKTAPIKYPAYLSPEAVSLLKGLLDRYVGDRFDLDEVRAHPWMRGVDWAAVRASARAGTPVPYLDELMGGARELLDDRVGDAAGLFSEVTFDDPVGPAAPAAPADPKKRSMRRPRSAAAPDYRQCKKLHDASRMKIWGYEYDPPSEVTSVATTGSTSLSSSISSSAGRSGRVIRASG